MKEIQLTQGKVALVDDADFEWLNQWKWSLTENGVTFYARRCIGGTKNPVKIYMHRLILGLTEKEVVCDHIDLNGLNNQRSNLRPCTRADNQRNKAKKRNSNHLYKGITKSKSRWMAQLSYKNKHVFLGTYETAEEAALAYNKGAKELFGEFANLNKL